MPCLIRRDDDTLAYISKCNEWLIGNTTPRPKKMSKNVVKRKISNKEEMIINNLILEINRIINEKEMNPLMKQYYYRKISSFRNRLN